MQYIGIITIYHHPWIRISVLGMFLSFLSSNILNVDGQNHSRTQFLKGRHFGHIGHPAPGLVVSDPGGTMGFLRADGSWCDMMVHAWVMLDASMYNKSWYVMIICLCYHMYMYIIYVNVWIEDEPNMIQMGNGVMMWWFWVLQVCIWNCYIQHYGQEPSIGGAFPPVIACIYIYMGKL